MLHYSTKLFYDSMVSSHSSISSSASAALYGTHDLPREVFCNVWDVADRVAVRKKVPASSAIAVVVEPRAKDEVSSDGEEETKFQLA